MARKCVGKDVDRVDKEHDGDMRDKSDDGVLNGVGSIGDLRRENSKMGF